MEVMMFACRIKRSNNVVKRSLGLDQDKKMLLYYCCQYDRSSNSIAFSSASIILIHPSHPTVYNGPRLTIYIDICSISDFYRAVMYRSTVRRSLFSVATFRDIYDDRMMQSLSPS